MRRGRGQGRMARTLTRLGMACGRCAVLPECRAEGWAMPLHDWADERGWDSVHPVWLTYLLEYVQERLPEGYKAFLGGVPSLTVDAGHGKPDVSVRQWRSAA